MTTVQIELMDRFSKSGFVLRRYIDGEVEYLGYILGVRGKKKAVDSAARKGVVRGVLERERATY